MPCAFRWSAPLSGRSRRSRTPPLSVPGAQVAHANTDTADGRRPQIRGVLHCPTCRSGRQLPRAGPPSRLAPGATESAIWALAGVSQNVQHDQPGGCPTTPVMAMDAAFDPPRPALPPARRSFRDGSSSTASRGRSSERPGTARQVGSGTRASRHETKAGRWAPTRLAATPGQGIELDWVCDALAHACRRTKAPGPSACSGRAGNATPIAWRAGSSQSDRRASPVPMRPGVDAYQIDPRQRHGRGQGAAGATLLSGTFSPTEPSGGQVSPSFPPSSPTHSDTSRHDERRKSHRETAGRSPVWGEVAGQGT